MLSLSLKYWPDKVLRTKCLPCVYTAEERREIGDQMIAIMLAHNGYGLSAPQVGLDTQMFVMRDPRNHESGLIFCNPVVVSRGKDRVTLDEGCLSLPDVRVKIPRFKEIEISFQTSNITTGTLTFKYYDMHARCIQHEMDHLDGILIFDHINSNISRKLFLEKYAKRRRKHDSIRPWPYLPQSG